ncbi:hypothetical protein KGM_204474 [Danaus plexippus plexippus]|uniref:Uncharacterized protein n=1 Tax=Danaus plexippus plexippus TaxID=278856 RepID=A0A212EWX5_DANPL|nr:hypothetical protein KGM_204474 [Danaus plexippus plexippus]
MSVFEMLVCARQCARRKSLILTFGEFCVFAAELRRCSRQTRQTSNKPDSPVRNLDKELRDKEAICKYVNERGDNDRKTFALFLLDDTVFKPSSNMS